MALEPHLIAIVIFAALMHATWNALVKVSGDRFFTMAALMGTGTIILIPALFYVDWPTAEAWPYLLVSSLLHLGYFGVLIFSYRFGDLSAVYPVARGSSPVLIAVGAYLFAAQSISMSAALGLALASGGMCLFAFEKGLPTRHLMKPLLMALTVGVFIASYTVVDGIGLRYSSSAFSYIAWLSFLDGIPLMAWAFIFQGNAFRTYLRTDGRKAMVGGVFSLAAYALVLYVLSIGSMAHVSALRETSVLFAVVLGAVTLKERFGAIRWVAAIAIVTGVVTMHVVG
ncbi:MAG: EamA family transporter [Rhodospirillales bacterium]|jgi:drug/metabolite transporter (DMT)-like permease|nr:EamA family transporter [Rhodospirillales bacterium]MBT4038830.1 EamA family transporter [Rhodospirillales bacterium]MBT4626421.1 EamA family transporter [Rhodospirillales bacterium]MBT5350896.1 EamA family transporter [Rhodospirillales bacterium]MBT5520665.1 EamA family transporter [Rhodospirillales bacterium]